MDTLHPGYQVTTGLRLVRHLGAGGMGTVWVADHEKLGIEVVVKFLSETLAADADALARFKREVAAMVQVKSPHVVQTLDHGVTDDGLPYIVMELLEGEDLATTLAARGKLSPGELMHVVDGVAAALAKAHERGIIHRDIKPSNVFLCAGTPRPFVKVVDFGIAKRVGDKTLTATRGFIGTPAYMSPEQIAGGTVDARSDTWALGVLAYFALTGIQPFDGDTVASIVFAVTHNSPINPTLLDPALPSAVDAWTSRALARNPEHRFASATELADALAQALGESVRERPLSIQPPTPSWRIKPEGAKATQTFVGMGATLPDGSVAPSPFPSRSATWWKPAIAITAVLAAVTAVGGVRLAHRGNDATPTAASAPDTSSGVPTEVPSAATPPTVLPAPVPPSTSAPALPAGPPTASIVASAPKAPSHSPYKAGHPVRPGHAAPQRRIKKDDLGF